MPAKDLPPNPFASPLAHDETPAYVDADIEARRHQMLSHEASVKSIGTLYYLGSVLCILHGLLLLVGMAVALGQGGGPAEFSILAIVTVLLLGLGGVQFWIAGGLRRLDPVARIPAICLAVIGLLGFPIGTLISIYFLYLLGSEKGRQVMSKEYQAIVAATPHIKYKTSIIVWIFVGLLVALVTLGIVAAVLNG